MKTFKVYQSGDKRVSVPRARFNGWALFFPLFWAIYYRVWTYLFLNILLGVGRYFLIAPLSSPDYSGGKNMVIFTIFFGLQIYLASWANKLREFSLEERDYTLIGEYDAKNGDVAIERSRHLVPEDSQADLA